MGLKTDWEFLSNVSLGAVGARLIIHFLKTVGFKLICVDRSAVSSKLWSIKTKRLRVPDLLCLRSGMRIECRAKNDLGIIMSHSSSPGREWDNGLRDQDLIALTKCFKSGDIGWQPSDRVALFRVGDLRATRHLAKESRRKASSEGNEIFLKWPSIVPKKAGKVLIVEEGSRIVVRYDDSGRKKTFSLAKTAGTETFHLMPHVAPGDAFGEGDRIIASALPAMYPTMLTNTSEYDFRPDLQSGERATVYAATKALGYLLELRTDSIPYLAGIMAESTDPLVQLEAAGALARLGEDAGWQSLEFLLDAETGKRDDGVRLEAVLLLGEIGDSRALGLLENIAINDKTKEIRSAALWEMGNSAYELVRTKLLNAAADHDEDVVRRAVERATFQILNAVADYDEDVALHAIASASRLINDENVDSLLDTLGEDRRLSAAIAAAIKFSKARPVERIVAQIGTTEGERRFWLLYLLATFGRTACEQCVRSHAPELLLHINFYWVHCSENWVNRPKTANDLSFLMHQIGV